MERDRGRSGGRVLINFASPRDALGRLTPASVAVFRASGMQVTEKWPLLARLQFAPRRIFSNSACISKQSRW